MEVISPPIRRKNNMGMDFIPRNKKLDPFHITWTGWTELQIILKDSVVSLDQFNDGVYLSKDACEFIANRLEEYAFVGYNEEDKKFWKDSIPFWKNCHGCWQW
jgi:hypothetical protein